MSIRIRIARVGRAGKEGIRIRIRIIGIRIVISLDLSLAVD